MVLSVIFGVAVGVPVGYGLFAVLYGVPCMAVFLLMLGGAMIGFMGGMLFMRDSYLGMLLEERWEKRQIMAQSERRADEQRRIGYAVGLKMGSLPGRK